MLPSNWSALGEQPVLAAQKILIVRIDDGLFGCHLDWVEAVYPAAAARVHGVRGAGGARRFVLHGEDAAAVVDLREMLGLHELLGETRREAYLILRSGALRLGVPIDACVGVRELDLRRQTPIPARVVRDGGLPLGHLLELDGRVLTVLDPSRLLDAALRETLAPLQARARAYQQRQAKIDALWEAMRRDADVEQVRSFARLCRRGGRGRAALAARAVLRHLDGDPASPNGELDAGADALVGALIGHLRERSSGWLQVETSDGAASGAIALAGGRVVNAVHGGREGRAALARLLAAGARPARFSDATPGPTRIADGTVASIIAALETLPAERGPRGR